MILSSYSGPPAVTGEGIYFQKWQGARVVKFLVTRAALSQLAGAPLEIRQLELEYQRYHDLIAEAARWVFAVKSRSKKVLRIGPEDVLEAMGKVA